jgi:hypothetical protein
MKIPFTGGAYLSSSINLDAQRCINLYPVTGESGAAKASRALFGTEGLRLLATLDGAGGLRALYKPSIGDAIAVQGSSVYRVTTDYVATLVGSIDTDATPVSIKDDGVIAVMVSGAYGYQLRLTTNTLTQITDEAFYGAARVSYQNLKFIFERPGTAQFSIATQEAGALVFDALDFATAESNAEPIVSHIVNHSELLLFKSSVTEVWRDSGNADFAYARDGNAAIEQGCAATHSVSALDNTVFWLGADKSGQGIVWRMNGYTPLRVSNDGVEAAIQRYGDISDARSYHYQRDGHTFYVLNFPAANATWVYDIKEHEWHERRYLNPATGDFGRHRGCCHMFFGGEHVVGDWENGNLYALDPDCHDDNGDPLVALRSCPHVFDSDNKNLRIDWLEVLLEAGVGLQDGQGDDPVMMLRWSKDGGHTWSTLRTISMGLVGQYARRARQGRMGKARDWVFEISISDPVKRVILGATVQGKVLAR